MSKSAGLGRPFVKRYYTRLEAARALGISEPGWRKLERRGVVVAVPIAKAVGYQHRVGAGRPPSHVIRAEDVARLRDTELVKRMGEGQVSAAAFELFVGGKTVVDVVVALKIPPERAKALHDAFREAHGYVLLPVRVVEDLRALGFKTIDADTFVSTVERLLNVARATRARGSLRSAG